MSRPYRAAGNKRHGVRVPGTTHRSSLTGGWRQDILRSTERYWGTHVWTLVRPVSVLNSRPLNASRRRLPSASTSSSCVRMSLDVSRSSSFGKPSRSAKCALVSTDLGDPGNAEGGADEPDRLRPLLRDVLRVLRVMRRSSVEAPATVRRDRRRE